MSTELVETSRVSLSNAHRDDLMKFRQDLGALKNKFADMTLSLEAFDASYKSQRSPMVTAIEDVRVAISTTTDKLKSFSNDLVSGYNIDLNNGSWSLSLDEYVFVQHKPQLAVVETATPEVVVPAVHAPAKNGKHNKYSKKNR